MGRDGTLTRDRLLRAGERVFARNGVGGASLREINAAAGQRNNSALHYHFGSRDGLLAAIGRKHQREIDGERMRLLDASAGGPLGVADIVAIWITPMVAKLHTDDGRDYLRILPALVHQLGGVAGVGPEGADGDMDLPGLRRVFEEMRAAMPPVPDGVGAARLIEASHFLAASLAARATTLASGAVPIVDAESYERDLVAMLAAAIAAPPAP